MKAKILISLVMAALLLVGSFVLNQRSEAVSGGRYIMKPSRGDLWVVDTQDATLTLYRAIKTGEIIKSASTKLVSEFPTRSCEYYSGMGYIWIMNPVTGKAILYKGIKGTIWSSKVLSVK